VTFNYNPLFIISNPGKAAGLPLDQPLVQPSVSTPPAIKYQFAKDLYENLQQLLFHPHPPFEFHGTFSIIADPAIPNDERARIVSRQLLAQTILYFQYAASSRRPINNAD
jgi:hypothetical protein